MKITVVCDVLGAPNNGTSIAGWNLINFLKAKGHQVKVVCPDEEHRGEEGFYILPTLSVGVFNSYVRKNGVSIANVNFDLIDEACHDADIVHVLLPFAAGHKAAIYCNEHHIPVTAGFHCQAENITNHFFLMNSEMATKFTYRTLNKVLYRYVDAIHYPTEFIRDLVKKYGIKAPREYAISNGVNSRIFYEKEVEKPEPFKDKFVIMMSGRYSHEKNQKLLLKAISKSKYNDKIQLVLAGGGPMREKLAMMAVKYCKNIPLMKAFDREGLCNAINYSDLYVHTSNIEIEAVSCLEALFCGLVPVISDSPRSATSRFALIPESQFKHNNATDLANKIDWWIEHPEERIKYKKIYHDYASQFDFDKCMQRMEDMLIEVKENYGKEGSDKRKK